MKRTAKHIGDAQAYCKVSSFCGGKRTFFGALDEGVPRLDSAQMRRNQRDCHEKMGQWWCLGMAWAVVPVRKKATGTDTCAKEGGDIG